MRCASAASSAVKMSSGSRWPAVTTTGGAGTRCAQRSASTRSSARAHKDRRATRGKAATKVERSSSESCATCWARRCGISVAPASHALFPFAPESPECRIQAGELVPSHTPADRHTPTPDPRAPPADDLANLATRTLRCTPVATYGQVGETARVQKTRNKRAAIRTIAGAKRVRYRDPMGRPPQPPRSYVTRHIRFRRAIDAGIRRACIEERRGFNDLVQIIVEDWLRQHARTPPEDRAPLPPP